MGTEDRIPAHAEITVVAGGRPLTSPIGGTGGFYFESLPPGSHAATIRERSGQDCSFTVTVPSSELPELDLGAL